MTINVQQLKQKMDSAENFVLIDVREEYEFEEFNIGGRLIPLGQIMNHLTDLKEEIGDQEIILHCRSGARSATAQQLMLAAGFENVYNLEGGVLAWQEAFK